MKGRCVQINLQPRVAEGLKNLQKEDHIAKVSICSVEKFIFPIVIKKSIKKLALDTKI